VGDWRRDERSPEKVLGYIQQHGSSFEVLNIEAPRRHVTFDHVESAVASFTTLKDIVTAGDKLARLSPLVPTKHGTPMPPPGTITV